MGDMLAFYRQDFRVAPDREAEALEGLKEAHASERLPVIGRAPLESATTLDAALRALGFDLGRDGRGYVVRLACEEDVRAGVEERLFELLAPYVEEGCFVDLMARPDEGLLRYRFDGEKCSRRHVKMGDKVWATYVERHEAEEEAAEQHAPTSVRVTWKQVAKTKPETMPGYDLKSAFPKGSWLSHARFGPGLVLAVLDGKVRVLFETGERTLAARAR